MATVVKVNYSEDSPFVNGDGDVNDGPPGYFKDSQAGVVELSEMISQPGMKRSESSDILHLSLHQLARDGDEEVLRKFLQYLHGNIKKKINQKDDESLSALHYAARHNHVNICRILVEAGANVNDVDPEGATPLHFAARYKRMRLSTFVNEDEDGDGVPDGEVPESTPENSVIVYLVSVGASVNKTDIYGCTPLHFAAMRGNEIATKELLSCDAINIEAIDKTQMTALHLAASHDEGEIVRMLIEFGANLRCCDEDMGTPLHFACMEGSESITKMLFEAGEKQDGWVTVSQMVTDQDNQQNTALHLAVENRSFPVANICIEKGANVNTPRQNYQTPLHLAAMAGELSIVQLLLEHGARIDTLDINQETPLYKAAAYNHVSVVEFLLDKGAKMNRHDKDGFSPLLISACNGHTETLKTLLDKGANIFDVDKNDKTAMIWAAEEDHDDTLKVLIDHPRKKDLIDLSDRYLNSPLHIACNNGILSCVKLLLDAGADMDAKNDEEQTPLHLAAQNGKTNCVRELVRRNKTVINDEDEDSNTALHLAALQGHTKVAKALIKAGADIEARNATLWTPLDCAAAKGWHKICKVLLDEDAPVDPMDKSKTTPLHLASSRGHLQVVNLLINSGASVSQRDADGHNCLDLAIDNNHEDVATGIINSNKWKEALMNETLDLTTGLRITPLRRLIKKMPDVAEKVFNKCTTSNHKNPDHPSYQITFDYQFLDDMYANWRDMDMGSETASTQLSIYDDDNKLVKEAKPYSTDSGVLKDNHPLMIMVSSSQEDLLAHPLVTALLRLKWNTFGRYVYYLNLFIYCIFLTFLTGYIVTTEPPYMYYKDKYYELEGQGLSECMRINATAAENGEELSQDLFAKIAKFVIIFLAAFKLLGELFQIYNAKMNYFGWENLIEWLTYTFALLLVIDFDKCEQETGVRTAWQWQLGAVAIFLAWIDLVLFIRKVPRFGIYVVMFTDVLRTFIQFFPVFFLFIVAFALAFYALLKNQLEFDNIPFSLLKTSVMMIGEMEFANIFLDQFMYDGNFNDEANWADRTFLSPATYTIFALFLVLVTIILMNLLVGLAVDDIKAVQEQAVLKRLAMQVELALDVEAILPHIIRKHFIRRIQTIEPNRGPKGIKSLLNMKSGLLSSNNITKALNEELDDYEQIQENQEKIMDQIGVMKGKIKAMNERQGKMEAMMTALLEHHGVNYEDEDIVDDA